METDASYLPEPRKRSTVARILAVVVLVAAVVVVGVVITQSLAIDDDGGSGGAAADAPARENKGEIPKKYTVQEGDLLSTIAEEYDISVKRIERLNPDLDPNTLAAGQVIRLH